MFYCIRGTLIVKDLTFCAVDCDGVAFKCYTSANTLQDIGGVGTNVTLFTYLSVKEDALDLFGFSSERELEFFKLLISVSGVGPKAALSILSSFDIDSLSIIIANNDSKAITRANGIGPKIAQRIVLELKNKMKIDEMSTDVSGSQSSAAPVTSKANEAVSALEFLGYSRQEAAKAVREVDGNLSVEDIIKSALSILSGNF